MKIGKDIAVSTVKDKVMCFFWVDLPCEHVKVRRCVKGHVVYYRPSIWFCEKSCRQYTRFVKDMEAEED